MLQFEKNQGILIVFNNLRSSWKFQSFLKGPQRLWKYFWKVWKSFWGSLKVLQRFLKGLLRFFKVLKSSWMKLKVAQRFFRTPNTFKMCLKSIQRFQNIPWAFLESHTTTIRIQNFCKCFRLFLKCPGIPGNRDYRVFWVFSGYLIHVDPRVGVSVAKTFQNTNKSWTKNPKSVKTKKT